MKNIKITPALLDQWNTYKDGKEWGLSIIGDGMLLSELLPKFERADWMVWTLVKSEVLTKVQIVRLAVICAETVLHIYEQKYPADNRPREAIESAVRYTENPTEENRLAAVSSAAAPDAAAAAYAAADAAAYAAYAAAYAAYAAYAADAAAYAAAYAADAARVSAKKEHHKKMCGLILGELDKFKNE